MLVPILEKRRVTGAGTLAQRREQSGVAARPPVCTKRGYDRQPRMGSWLGRSDRFRGADEAAALHALHSAV